MKNYQKIYNRLVKEITRELIYHKKSLIENKKETNNDLFVLIEDKYGITLLEWILSMLSEIEGKNNKTKILMGNEEFKQWKKKITI
jgi:hypothetical protein